MITYLFHSFEDDLSPYTHDDFQSSLRSCDSYPFRDSYLFCEYFHSHFHLDFDGYKVMVIPEKPKIHIKEQQYFRPKEFYKMKGKQYFSSSKISFFLHEDVSYLLSSSMVSHGVFFRSLISSQSSTSSGILSEDEDETSSICGSPIHRWIDQACGYSFQQNFLHPTHLHDCFLWLVPCLFMLMIIFCLTYLCCITWLSTGGDTLMRC